MKIYELICQQYSSKEEEEKVQESAIKLIEQVRNEFN